MAHHLRQSGGRVLLARIGLDADEIMGGDLWKEVPTDRTGPGARAMERGTVETADSYYEPLDRWFEVTAFPYGDGLVVLLTDITEERKTERALRDVAGRYRAMVEHAPHGLVVIDAEAEALIDFNDRALSIFGRTREEMEGSSRSSGFTSGVTERRSCARSASPGFRRTTESWSREASSTSPSAAGPRRPCGRARSCTGLSSSRT